MTFRRSLIAGLIFLSMFFRLSAQEKGSQVDSLVRLLSAQSMELIEKDGVDYRKVTGPARFLHNDTFLICDTALWNVRTNEIFAISNVKILQDQTVLTGDKLTYYVDRDLAEFRGSLVQLEDKDHNVLRTEFLDYNTRDSVAIFFNGGSMKDAEGQVIESRTGTYDSKAKTFTFSDNVNMFTDSVFVKTTNLVYDSARNKASFGFGTDAWSEDNMLSSNAGWYDRNREIFLFRLDVHGMSDTQEGWADSLFYYRPTGDIELLGNAQVTDTTRDMSAVAGRMLYTDSLSRLVMTREPAVIGVVKSETAPPDSVYFGADSIVAQSLMMFQIEDAVKSAAKSRLEDLSVDAVRNYRQKAAKEAAEAAAKAAENDPNRPKGGKKGGADKVEGDVKAPKVGAVDKGIDPNAAAAGLDSKPVETDSLTTGPDSLAVGSDSLASATDSLAVQTDSIPEPLDSTKISFITAVKNVKLYKSDIQIACDSLAYNDLDSLVRMYERPIVWNESNRQYSADSLFAVLKNQSLQKASLMSNAFIAIKEDTLCYDQIRATEMLAYFDTTGALSRFDAMGDANAIFYLQEDSVYATVNKSEAKMLSAYFKNGDIDRVYYFESAKNDGYPVAQMTSEERVLKGFSWQPELRPSGRQDVTPYSIRPSERSRYAARPRASFEYTDKFYPGYMPGVMKEIERGRLAKADAKARKKEAARVMPADTASVQSPDSLANVPPKDSLNAAVPAVADSTKAATDSLSMSSDSSSVNAAVLDAAALKKAQRDSLRAAKDAAREAKWARLDSLDAAKAKLAADKKAANLRAKKLKQLKAIKAREAKENARLEKYKAVFAKKKEKEDRKAAERAAREAEKAAREAEKSAENAVDVPVEEEKS
ncbi:MAG: OstA-like protein [Bacteroides sp.]|nr:OstA-like protein [Bacteroides sp.]